MAPFSFGVFFVKINIEFEGGMANELLETINEIFQVGGKVDQYLQIFIAVSYL